MRLQWTDTLSRVAEACTNPRRPSALEDDSVEGFRWECGCRRLCIPLMSHNLPVEMLMTCQVYLPSAFAAC